MQQADQSIVNRGYSLVQDCGYYSSSCGYCKKDEESSVSTGKSAHGECGSLLSMCKWFHARHNLMLTVFTQACTRTG